MAENMTEKLSASARNAAIAQLDGWSLAQDGEAITKSFKFDDFSEAFAFMTRVALLAEKADHHPDWRNVWNRVEIVLSTHSAGGLTEKDIALATKIESLKCKSPRPYTKGP